MNPADIAKKVYDKSTKKPPQWNDSIIDQLLKKLPDKLNEKLSLDAIERAIELRREYGQSGESEFDALVPWATTQRFEEAKKLLTEKKASNYKALVDYLAVLILTPGGARIGDKWFRLWRGAP